MLMCYCLDRPVLMNTSGKKPKYIHQIYDEKVCVEQVIKQQYIGHKHGKNYFRWDIICLFFFNIKRKTTHCYIQFVDCDCTVHYLGLFWLFLCILFSHLSTVSRAQRFWMTLSSVIWMRIMLKWPLRSERGHPEPMSKGKTIYLFFKTFMLFFYFLC